MERIGPDQILERARRAWRMLAPCSVCPWTCGVDRRVDPSGRCGSGLRPIVSAVNIHRGEEPPLSGTGGSGTVFLAGCTLDCAFCQNWPISHLRHGEPMTLPELGRALIALERRGAHNINFVTPTHFTPQILAAVAWARRHGLTVPLVWNSSGFERVELLRLLEGVVEIYLPDFKYWDDDAAERCSRARGYRAAACGAIAEMARQVGPLRLDERGLAVSGLIVRHLVLPQGLAGTRHILEWMAQTLPPGIALSLMGQYFPAGRALSEPPLSRGLTREEYAAACDLLDDFPEIEGWTQDLDLPGGC